MKTHLMSQTLTLTMTAVLGGLLLTACGDQGSARSSVIKGQVLGLNSPAGVAVGVVGRKSSVMTDASGQFQLARPVEDNLRLRFARSSDDISSELDLSSREPGHLSVKVRLKGHEVELVEIEHQGLGELEGAVASLDRAALKLKLASGRTIALDALTVWDPEGDLFTLDSLEAALRQGSPVRIEAWGSARSDGALVASIIKVEVDGNELEPGDDKGMSVEPGDDSGKGVEPGDDNGKGAEPGDDKGQHGSK